MYIERIELARKSDAFSEHDGVQSLTQPFQIAAAISLASPGPGHADLGSEASANPASEAPMPAASTVRSMIRDRRGRDQFFTPDLFADPAWDILLDLLLSHIEQRRVSVSSVVIASAVPATTGLRCIAAMTERGLIARESDRHDGRRINLHLTSPALMALKQYFSKFGPGHGG